MNPSPPSPAPSSPASHSTAGRDAEATARRRPRTWRLTRRPALSAAAVATVGLGLGVRFLADGAWTGPAGDALYAVLVYLLVAWSAPRRSPLLVVGVGVVVCWLIELFQLTGLPLMMAEAWWPAQLVLGTGFVWVDLLAYAAGGAAAAAADVVLARGARGRRMVHADR